MKVGGNVSYKINVAPYETMEISSFFEIELSGDFSAEEIKEKQDSISKVLKDDINKKAKEFMENYHEKIKRLKSVWEN